MFATSPVEIESLPVGEQIVLIRDFQSRLADVWIVTDPEKRKVRCISWTLLNTVPGDDHDDDGEFVVEGKIIPSNKRDIMDSLRLVRKNSQGGCAISIPYVDEVHIFPKQRKIERKELQKLLNRKNVV
ncbi:MAG: hypothetical protein M1338_03880 [Patescibacteria group bacterium]|nr:hypothetical protein [Patescibacteria group bacterium]